jgi:hypothetical protein
MKAKIVSDPPHGRIADGNAKSRSSIQRQIGQREVFRLKSADVDEINNLWDLSLEETEISQSSRFDRLICRMASYFEIWSRGTKSRSD